MRCGSCEKFVSMDMGDPEVDLNDVEIDYADDGKGTGTVSGTVRIVRVCADCSDELKEATLELTHEFPLPPKDEAVKAVVTGARSTTPGPDALVAPAFEDEPAEHEFEIEEDDVNPIEESHKKKSYFGAEVCFTVTCICGCGFTYSGSMQDKVAASEMDELG